MSTTQKQFPLNPETLKNQSSNGTGNLEHDIKSNAKWLRDTMAPYFFAAMQDEPEAIAILDRSLGTLKSNQRLILADRPNALIIAAPNTPGSLYRTITLGGASDRPISYAMFAHSDRPMPGMKDSLEIQRIEFDCKSDAWVKERQAAGVKVPAVIREAVAKAMLEEY